MTAATTYEIGTVLGSCATLTSLSIVNPESNFTDYPDTIKLADGTIRGKGFPLASWHFGYLSSAQYDALRAFCAPASAAACIATMNNDRDFIRYDCVMLMPDTFVVRAGRYVDVTVEFSHLVEAE
jgi:hypothetical protein